MDDLSLLTELQPLFRSVLDQPSLVITRESSALDVANWDSLSHISLVAAIQKKYKIKFALGELQDLKNVGDMVDLMMKKLATT